MQHGSHDKRSAADAKDTGATATIQTAQVEDHAKNSLQAPVLP
jgi:hypothetical protein